MAEMITLTPAQAKEQIMLSRLPELAKALRGVFVNESKTVNVLPEDLVVKKVYRGYKEKLSRGKLSSCYFYRHVSNSQSIVETVLIINISETFLP